MTSICAWRFSHMPDIRNSDRRLFLVMQLEPVMRLLSSLHGHCFLECYALSGQVPPSKRMTTAFTESYGCFSFIVRTSSAKDDRAMTRSNWDR